MADETTPTTDEQVEPVPASEVDEEVIAPAAPEVVSQEGALVGDENQPDAREPEVYVNQDSVTAQVAPERQAPADNVPVHEVQVTLDEVILDPSAPEAVQVPDAGRGFLDLPIHALANGSPEKRFEDGTADEATDPGSLTPPTNE
jgi:hypothetical protein